MLSILQLDDLDMAYEAEGSGVAAVFLHQVATDHRVWQYQHNHFCTKYRVITVDVLGHGQVAWPEDQLSIEQTARRVRQLLERLRTGPAILVGVSMGAAVAMQVALDAPVLVRGLVLVSPWSQTTEHMRSLIEKLFQLAEEADMAAYADLFVRYTFPTACVEQRLPVVARLRALALEQDAPAVAYALGACAAVNLVGEIKRIQAPSLIFTGLKDLFTPPYLGRAVAKELSQAELEVWEEGGHFPFLEDPVRFNHRLESFFRRCLEPVAGL